MTDENPTADLHPRTTKTLIGHQNAEQLFVDLLDDGHLPHAWLITGPAGVGKATLAYRFAALVLAAGNADRGAGLFGNGDRPSRRLTEDDEGVRRVRAGSHPDLLIVERGGGQEDDDGPKKRDIGVEEIRRLGHFLRLTPAVGGWRVVIVDSADDLTRNAANALLKLLEEPPSKVLILLISNSSYSLLPTIRSRCRRLVLSALADDEVSAVLEKLVPQAAPDDRLLAARLAEGSPGRAVDLLAGDGLDLFRAVLCHLERLPELDLMAVDNLGDAVSRARDKSLFDMLFDSLDWWLRRIAKSAATRQIGDLPILADAENTVERLRLSASLAQWLEVWEKIGRLRTRTKSANLDHKLAVISAFNLLQATVRT